MPKFTVYGIPTRLSLIYDFANVDEKGMETIYRSRPFPAAHAERSSLKDQAAELLRTVSISENIVPGTKVIERDVAEVSKLAECLREMP